jgi:hypothetical protein
MSSLRRMFSNGVVLVLVFLAVGTDGTESPSQGLMGSIIHCAANFLKGATATGPPEKTMTARVDGMVDRVVKNFLSSLSSQAKAAADSVKAEVVRAGGTAKYVVQESSNAARLFVAHGYGQSVLPHALTKVDGCLTSKANVDRTRDCFLATVEVGSVACLSGVGCVPVVLLGSLATAASLLPDVERAPTSEVVDLRQSGEKEL